MDSYDNDWLFLDDDLFFVVVPFFCDFVDESEEDNDGMDRVQP